MASGHCVSVAINSIIVNRLS